MQKELKDYAHLYIGCQIELNESKFADEQEDRVFTLGGVWGNSFCVNELGDFWYKFEAYHNGESHDKLLLRPLSDMTDSEFGEWYKLNSPLHSNDVREESEKQARCTKYLLDKRFDIFGLIENGTAIDKTKIIKP